MKKFATIDGTLGYYLIKFFHLFPIQKKMVFVSFNGNYISDSPKEIYKSLQKQGLNYQYIWLVKNEDKKIEGARSIKIKSLRAMYHLATAKVWVDNCRKREWVTKKKGQYYLQTWHGGIGMKKSEAQVEDKLEPKYIECAKNDSRMIDTFLSGSKWCTDLYSNWFYYEGPVIESGCPRSDVFYKKELWPEIKERVNKTLGIEKGKRVILYAPTFRQDYTLVSYDIDYHAITEAASERWGGEWIFAFRLHPNVCGKDSELKLDKSAVNATTYDEMNELIIACDVLITDYSSCMFDGMEAGKKVLLYVPDYEAFSKTRDLCWELDELPFPYAKNNLVERKNNLVEKIKDFDDVEYERKCKTFMREKCGFFNSKDSADRAAAILMERALSV